MPSGKSRYIIRVAADTTLLFIVIIGVVLMKKLFSPFKRGMYCDDDSLSYPYKDDSISDTILIVYTFVVPLVVICFVEFFRSRKEKIGKDFGVKNDRISSYLWTLYSTVGIFLFGVALTLITTDIGKFTLGSLRPHFIDVCQPDWSKLNCTSGRYEYVDPIPCTTTDQDRLRDARMSFPSGHASLSTYSMFFLVIYLQARLQFRGLKLLVPVLQYVLLAFNFYTCLTRIQDNKHHWGDIFAGFLIGGAIAILISVFAADIHPHPTPCRNGGGRGKTSSVMLNDHNQHSAEDRNFNATANGP